ncbi:DUF998 domain-containing protein [Mucilaginibacter sp.]|uniref:DUF998 domain-containing protein n=1 Tax=Mucilaginibacter sp. TaxID=1882438 RepID=UPI002847C66D|nr:DUF998 domain-containing protein [Mucilaginibacter sp.]MDR3693835.1 DUF998 domain-containing protein [Mucilaginibacter sp.]
MSKGQMINMPANKPLWQVVLLCCGFAGILFTLIYTVFGFFTPGFNAFRDTISGLELVKNGWVQQGNFMLYGVLTILFTIGLSKELIKSANARYIVLFQLLIGTGLIGEAIFIHEPPHQICDIIVYISAPVVLFLFTWQFYKTNSWKGWIVYSLVAAFMMMALKGLSMVAVANHHWPGLFERFVFLPYFFWLFVLIIKMLSGRRLVAAG